MEKEKIDELHLIARLASTRTLEAYGAIPITISRKAVVEKYGRGIFETSKKYVKWNQKGHGKNARWTCEREDFEHYILKFDLELKEL